MNEIQRDIKKHVTPDAIGEQALQVSGDNCASAVDGIDIEYRVEFGGDLYVLDSCRTAIDSGTKAWQTLSSIWTYFNEISS